MRLTERLKGVSAEAAKIRESMTFHDPRNKNFNQDYGLDSSEKMVRGRGTPEWDGRLAEAAGLISDVFAGKRPDWHLKEAMTTIDFPLLFGDLLYRQMLGNYQPWPVTYPQWTRIIEVRDFRKLNLYTLDGGQGLLDKVAERAPYPETKFVEGRYQIQVAKYGRRYSIDFEMVVNDDLNAFRERPLLMATGARRSEEYLATTMLLDVNGPHASFFTSGNKNIITGNPALTVQGLQTAYKVLSAQKDTDLQPIMIESSILMVGPNLEVTAQNILNSLQLRINAASGGGTADQFLYAENWMRGKVKLVVNPYIPYIATSLATDPWFLIANPNDYSQRPAVAFAFLRGYRQPQLFIKDPDARLLGGGNSDPMDGDFNTDSIDYKLRHIFGATQVDPKMAVSSTSAGS